ncbi:MAG: hypothetical protein DRP70_02875 [Spirochaetes bacterium]|nr:MAG: hypothetical protein DRP49_08150 [Spirochaetota bacterium]RKX89724.1 MAG: hypothetical protein DRP70_02875 [Spirochaetota bacterium]RKX98825.1 MAG: hypothetical protein DRZ90_01440 [Spirochaetota bacterium]
MSISSIIIFGLNGFIFFKYDQIIDQYGLFNDYLVAINEVGQEMESIIRQENFDRKNLFFFNRDKLLSNARRLRSSTEDLNLGRRYTDLYFLAQSYTNEATSAIRLMIDGYPSAAIPVYEQARHLFYLTNQHYYRTYETLALNVNQGRQQAARFRFQLNAAGLSIIVVLIVISMYLAAALSGWITSPIKSLTTIVSNAAISNHEIDTIVIEEHNIDEYDNLTTAYNIFATRINEYFLDMKRNADLERKLHDEETRNLKITNLLKVSELKALQSRINPHFMFNSINMIKNVAFIEGAGQATELLESFGSFLRYNYDKFDKVVTIKDEYQNVVDYFAIQKIRMGDRLIFEIDFDQSTFAALLPCLIIQPLVENAIDHGVSSYISDAFVRVEAKVVEKRVFLTVEDNGVGIEKKRLTRLNSLILTDNLENEFEGSIGISNVISRLSIFFNGDLHYKLEARERGGTIIRIDIPYKNDNG